MGKWKFGLAVVLMTGALAACNNNDHNDETPMEDQGASDYVTPRDNNGVNNNYNDSEGLYMNDNNANVETPTTNKDYNGTNGATTNEENNMNGAGSNNGTNNNGNTGVRGNNDNNNVINDAATDVEDAADRIVDDGKDIVDDAKNKLQQNTIR